MATFRVKALPVRHHNVQRQIVLPSAAHKALPRFQLACAHTPALFGNSSHFVHPAARLMHVRVSRSVRKRCQGQTPRLPVAQKPLECGRYARLLRCLVIPCDEYRYPIGGLHRLFPHARHHRHFQPAAARVFSLLHPAHHRTAAGNLTAASAFVVCQHQHPVQVRIVGMCGQRQHGGNHLRHTPARRLHAI